MILADREWIDDVVVFRRERMRAPANVFVIVEQDCCGLWVALAIPLLDYEVRSFRFTCLLQMYLENCWFGDFCHSWIASLIPIGQLSNIAALIPIECGCRYELVDLIQLPIQVALPLRQDKPPEGRPLYLKATLGSLCRSLRRCTYYVVLARRNYVSTWISCASGPVAVVLQIIFMYTGLWSYSMFMKGGPGLTIRERGTDCEEKSNDFNGSNSKRLCFDGLKTFWD